MSLLIVALFGISTLGEKWNDAREKREAVQGKHAAMFFPMLLCFFSKFKGLSNPHRPSVAFTFALSFAFTFAFTFALALALALVARRRR